MHPKQIQNVILGNSAISIEEFVAVARYDATVTFSETYRRRVNHSRSLMERFLSENRLIYGVTTGFGDNVTKVIAVSDAEILQRNIIRSHAVSVGEPLERELVRGIQLMVLLNLGQGYSGVRIELLELIAALLNHDILPFAPGEGSVGYLTPEAHMALVLIGEGQAWVNGKGNGQGQLMPGRQALAQAGLHPLTLKCKEGLALVNGTTSVTAIATLALFNAMESAKVADIAAAMSLEGLRGTIRAFDARYHSVKAHKEQADTAAHLCRILCDSQLAAENIDHRLQDCYSLRGIPQVHGASKKAIDDARSSIENELRSSGDNPIIFPIDEDDGIAISGANFDGCYVGIAADTLCIAMTNLAKISERRTDRMVNPHFNDLPSFLVKNPGLNSGYMIPQYTAAGLVGEMKILSHPATVDSIPTCGNQEDPVSFAYNASIKAYRISRKLDSVLAIELMTACQALDFYNPSKASSATYAVYRQIRSVAATVEEDRYFYPDMVAITEMVRSGEVVGAVENSFLQRQAEPIR